ncbi:BON domain-containing protein [Roseiarcaceae bacterium H3SJ34-1]|uniref:BON domain-containing protein n=1 Tax=Terripilifer ovatus TaxID=3032367 RepID=UPI003AB9595B|nr:BON domain-containing protein [Roseiarcaceae bacterium H3SJ34-1]
MNDLNLRQDILDELEFEPRVHAANIGVAVEKGVVTLTGHVTSYAEKLAAETATLRVKGVRAVAQEIEVRYPSDKKSSDDEIASRALNIIAWDATVPDGEIQVKVQDGWITLSGEVDWNYQKAAAEHAVRKLSGVVGVTNFVTVKPRVAAYNVKERIENALKRNAEVEADHIQVQVSGNKVTLNGKVQTWYERSVAERAAWAEAGVTMVDDRLTVA